MRIWLFVIVILLCSVPTSYAAINSFQPEVDNTTDLGIQGTLEFKDLFLKGSVDAEGDMTVGGVLFSNDAYILADVTVSAPLSYIIISPNDVTDPDDISIEVNDMTDIRIEYPAARFKSSDDNTSFAYFVTDFGESTVKRYYGIEVADDLTSGYGHLTPSCVIYLDPGEELHEDVDIDSDTEDYLFHSLQRRYKYI